jgi:hypothetical protein
MLKIELKHDATVLEQYHTQFSEGQIVDPERQFTLLHLAAETGSKEAVQYLGTRRLNEFSMKAKDGQKPLEVAVKRRLELPEKEAYNEKQVADAVIVTLATIKETHIRPLKKARTSEAVKN